MHASTVSTYVLISGRTGGAGAVQGVDGRFAGYLAPTTTTGAQRTADPDPVNTAALVAAKQAVAEQQAWIEGNFRRSSRDLAMKLPESDRAKLQALVDEGHVTWADINAALDARIKQATNALLTQQSDALNKMPASWQARQDAWTANQSWDLARREGRAAICARYGEKVADVMASDPGATEGTDTDPQATAKLMARQGILDRYRQIMDQELTALDQRLGPQPPRPNTLPVGFNPYEMAQFEARLTKQETMAAVKLAAVGGALSGALKDAIGHLAGEITQNVAKAVDG